MSPGWASINRRCSASAAPAPGWMTLSAGLPQAVTKPRSAATAAIRVELMMDPLDDA
jgi:hypothetical protein